MSVRYAKVGDPRYMISLDVLSKDRHFRIGANRHYTLDTPIVNALADFFTHLATRDEGIVVDLEKGKLKITYLDMPVVTEATLT